MSTSVEATPAVAATKDAVEATPSSNSSSSSSSAPAPVTTSVKDKLKKQVEFYFSDSNFRVDKFLKAKVAEDSDGYVALSVLLTFNRVKSMTSSVEEIAAAIENSDQLDLSTDRTCVRRAKPLPSEDDSFARSVYIKGPFPTSTRLEALEAWLAQFGEVKRIHMRRTRGSRAPTAAAAAATATTAPTAAAAVAAETTAAETTAAAAATDSANSASSSSSSSSSSAAAVPTPTAAVAATSGSGVFKGSIFCEFATEAIVASTIEAFKAGTLIFETRPVQKLETKAGYFDRKRAEAAVRKGGSKKTTDGE